MVILVLSAMAGTSKLLSPYINNAIDQDSDERYKEVSKYLLLNSGNPPNWGQNPEEMLETFGLAKTGSDNTYELDVDKISRLNSENLYTLGYAQIYKALKMPDVSFRIEIKPIFEVSINPTATFNGTTETTYEFEILTEKHGMPVQANVKGYVIAENYLEATLVHASDGKISLNITLPNDVNGPALFAVLAKTSCDSKVVSFGVCAFSHNSFEPEPKGTFLRLSPLNYVLNASFIYSEIALSSAYALTYDYNSPLTQTASNNQSATYDIPHFLDSGPQILVVAGRNSTAFFTEWTTYPQVPLQIGANFATSTALSNIFAYTYIVTIDSALYECTFWFGGPED
jgi:hypothetical protein